MPVVDVGKDVVTERRIFRSRRQRELEQFEERQRVVLERFGEELRQLAKSEKAPGAAAKRKGFFSF